MEAYRCYIPRAGVRFSHGLLKKYYICNHVDTNYKAKTGISSKAKTIILFPYSLVVKLRAFNP